MRTDNYLYIEVPMPVLPPDYKDKKEEKKEKEERGVIVIDIFGDDSSKE